MARPFMTWRAAPPEDLTAMVGRLALRLSVADPLSWLPVLAALGGVTVLAAIVPARRAARVDPVRVLRVE